VQEARALLEQGCARAERAGLLRTASVARGNLARLLINLEDPGGEDLMVRVLAEAEQLGMTHHRDACWVNLGFLNLTRGDLERASALFELCRRSDAKPDIWYAATVYLAEAALRRGDLASARALRHELPEQAPSEEVQRHCDRLDSLIAEAGRG
jgi:hypothetical protein